MNLRHTTAGLSRRSLLPLLATVAVPSGLAAGAVISGAKKKPKPRTVRRTFVNSTAIVIPLTGAADPYPSLIRVRGFKRAKVVEVNVVLDGVSHQDVSDIDVMVQSPNGRKAMILSDVGNAFDAVDAVLTFDDQEALRLPEVGRVTSDTYQPTNYDDLDPGFEEQGGPGKTDQSRLSVFNGINPNGDWKLWVRDDRTLNSGGIARGWKLIITARERR